MDVLVCVCGLEASWWWLSKEFCIYLGLRGGGWGRGNNILDFSCSTFCWFMIQFCQNLTNYFYLTKVAKFFGGDKVMQMLLYLQGMVYKIISSVANLAVFCFEDCWINCFIRSAIKRSTIITFNQEFIAFNEPMVLFLFSWCLIFCLTFPFHLTFQFPYFIERLKILIFSPFTS